MTKLYIYYYIKLINFLILFKINLNFIKQIKSFNIIINI